MKDRRCGVSGVFIPRLTEAGVIALPPFGSVQVVAAAADFEESAVPSPLAKTEQVKNLKREEARKPRVDYENSVIRGVAAHARQQVHVIAHLQPPEYA